MADNFLRKYRLTIEGSKGRGVIIQDQHIEFDVNLSSDSKLNELDLKIFNLSRDTISVFDEVDASVTLEVGFGTNPLAVIFKGNKIKCSTKREDTDVVTTLLAAEGSVTVREARTQTVAEENVTVKSLIEKIIKDSMPEIKVINLNGSTLTRTYPFGYSVSGSAKQALDKICADNNLRWHITQNTTINVFPLNGDTKRKAILITPTMIKNTPEKVSKEVKELKEDLNLPKKLGLNLTLQLNPLLLAGSVIKLQGTFNSDGVYVIDTVKHTGSYEGDSWDTVLECTNYTA